MLFLLTCSCCYEKEQQLVQGQGQGQGQGKGKRVWTSYEAVKPSSRPRAMQRQQHPLSPCHSLLPTALRSAVIPLLPVSHLPLLLLLLLLRQPVPCRWQFWQLRWPPCRQQCSRYGGLSVQAAVQQVGWRVCAGSSRSAAGRVACCCDAEMNEPPTCRGCPHHVARHPAAACAPLYPALNIP